ncbi:hypothetical protein [Allomuricauda sp. R78024]|uniref:hypothetical protein n=1 Tax=Allomuricauda sp. R78024 TaxID=3093867 RepID=UPI0037C86B14
MKEIIRRVLEDNKRLEAEKKNLMADIKILVQNKFSPDKVFVRSKWRKHFEKEETFKKLWKEIQPGKDRGNRST